MFVNGDAISLVTKLLTAGVMLLCLALMSHAVWITSLVRSRALHRFGVVGRIACLVLAAATPVISFYCAGIVRHLRPNPAGTGRTRLGFVGAFAAIIVVVLAITQVHYLAPGPHGADGFSRLPGMILVLAIPCAVLGMACQVLVRSNQARAGLIVVAGSAAICLFLLA